MPDKSQTKIARIIKYLAPPLADFPALVVPEELLEEPPPNTALNLFLKSLITSSNSGGVWLLPPQGLWLFAMVDPDNITKGILPN